ncbi:MAG: hypothetical protein F3744_11145 [Nitrospinae bacterium]|nr:hypothetical protein [Nitrospinota bacterium]
MKQFNKIMLLLLFGFVVLAQSAQAQTTARDTRNSASLAISPYAQAVPNDSYTFIGVSHPSLDTALTQIGVALEVIDMTTTLNNTAGRVAIFTVDAGETHRVFVVNQSHSTINTSNSSFTDARTHLINTVDSAQFGSIRITSVSERPENAAASRFVTVGSTPKFDNLAQLNIWGIVFIESAGTGFAMEFVGDGQDSTLGGSLTNINSTLGEVDVTADSTTSTNEIARPYRGIGR